MGLNHFSTHFIFFIYSVALGVSCSAWDVKLQHVGSSSLVGD